MSLKIIKTGLLDTLQDLGRYGHQQQGINPGGVMDRFSASLANALLGKGPGAPVVELHFPAAQILFEKAAVICLTGAHFTPVINDKEILLYQPIIINQGSVLRFDKWKGGARCYLSVLQNFVIDQWLDSYSTNLRAEAGGYSGRRLLKGDVLQLESTINFGTAKDFETLPWKYHTEESGSDEIEFTVGNEWNWLTTKSQTAFLNNEYTVTPASDRMGYTLSGEALEQTIKDSLISSAVTFGTVQLLPGGQLIILMADHQTVGGYPRVAHVISAHLPKLAQRKAGDKIKFAITDVHAAQKKLIAQQNYLLRLQNTCNLKM
ncbi:MAG TPA: biotin-dependent carboxyltransferase family protein, partial [Flavisolibacter sp.]|nr:biotin-dependent carboxyltransferase family protein [Flavisolibacter sp.]